MGIEIVLIALACVVTSALLTGLVRKAVLARGVLDIPNQRSSHLAPTPRGGGLAIVLASSGGWLVLTLSGVLSPRIFWALIGGGLAVALVGFFDDRHGLSPRIRLAVHVCAALWAIMWLGGLPTIQLGSHVMSLGPMGYVLGCLGIVWTLNLFNFMDGIDGIAASEAVFIACGGLVLGGMVGVSVGALGAATIFGAASLGFLLWNWPPAKIFMGDVGSGFLGYAVSVLALTVTRETPTALLAWLLLGGVFFVDATVTLSRRLARGERASEAHRSHAYQWLARRWRSHRSVTLAVLLVNVFWLLPWSFMVIARPAHTVWFVTAALLPLTVVAIVAGAGRPEVQHTL